MRGSFVRSDHPEVICEPELDQDWYDAVMDEFEDALCLQPVVATLNALPDTLDEAANGKLDNARCLVMEDRRCAPGALQVEQWNKVSGTDAHGRCGTSLERVTEESTDEVNTDKDGHRTVR